MLFGSFPVVLTQPGIEVSGPDDAELTHLIQLERVRLMFADTVPVVVVSALTAASLAAAIVTQTGQPWAVVWAVLCVLVSGVRLLHWRAYVRATQGDAPIDAPYWLSSLTRMCALQGTCWGMAGLMMPVNDFATAAIVVPPLVAASAMAALTLQAHFRTSLATNLPILVPTALVLLTRQDTYGLFTGLGLLALLALIVFENRRGERRILELLRLRFITDRVAQKRTAALATMQADSAVKDKFLATMSHEMRTPLHGMLGLARLTMERLPDQPGVLAESRHHIALLERAGEHLLHIINDVLDFSRIEADQLHIELAPFDLREVIDDVLGLLAANAAEKCLNLRADMQLPPTCWVMGDASRVRQILHNLLGNAIKFTDLGEVTLQVVRNPASQALQFRIHDTGAGIPPEELPLIFEAFHQAKGVVGRRPHGTGLGLTISREIARAMGGELAVESEVGRGSTFTLTLALPVAESPVPPADAAAAVMCHNVQVGAQRLEGHVLLVEDNPVNALVTEATLQRLGLRVTRAENGHDALALLTHQPCPFQLVLMDVQMPRLDGISACQSLRGWEREHGLAPVPVVALTANALSRDRALCMAAGMNGYLVKPFPMDDLMAVLQRHLPPAGAECGAVRATEVAAPGHITA